YSSWSEVAIVQSKEFIDKSAAAGTYYKYRVKAVDIYGNEAAAWATTSTGVTCTSISSELSDLEGELSTLDGELSGLAGELSTLESELENLQFADIGGTITEVQIGDDTVSAPKLKSNSVESAKIKAGAVTAEKIYANAVTTEKLNALAVTAEKIAAGAVTTEKLYAAAVTAEKIAADAIEANHIKAGSVTANKLEALLKIASGKAIQAGPDTDNYTMLPTGFERTKQFASKVYSVEARVKVYFAYSGEELTPSLSFSTDGGSSWSSWYGGVTLHEDGTTTGQWQWFSLNSAKVPKFATDVVGASLTNFKVKVRLVTNSGYVRVSTIDVIINGGSAGKLDTQTEWNNAKDASSDNVSTFDDSGEGYIRGTNTALSYTYIQTSASGFVITQAAQNLSKIVPTILNSGEVAFDGIETSKIVTFRLELEPSGYEVILIPLQYELSKTSWTPDTHVYKLHLECRKAQESPYGWFWLDFFMEEYSSDPNVYHSDSPKLTSSYQDLFTGGATMTQVDLGLYDWGALNIFKQKVWHQYTSAGSRTVRAKAFGGVTTISWGDGTTTNIKTFGGVRLKNITEIRSSVAKKPIAGKVNWILFQT
ncbi:MAG TPA: hypothetical protein PLA64_13815, partial [Mesotoga infera]|nr:hypothetical protein [Mesotoga infera]